MARKRLTQIFPWILPLRQWQRSKFFYWKMKWDKNIYSTMTIDEELPYLIYEDKFLLINQNSGMDIQYQYNKVHNLKIASGPMNGLIIRPGETFSFWQLVKGTGKDIPYKDGLILVDSKLVTTSGGGLCLLSNILFWGFIHSPLTIVERHTHNVKALPNPDKDKVEGVDATVAQGWKDLKVRNDTDKIIQIKFYFDDEYITLKLLSGLKINKKYEIKDATPTYISRKKKIFERINIVQKITDLSSMKSVEKLLYVNECEITYPLEKEIEIIEEESI